MSCSGGGSRVGDRQRALHDEFDEAAVERLREHCGHFRGAQVLQRRAVPLEHLVAGAQAAHEVRHGAALHAHDERAEPPALSALSAHYPDAERRAARVAPTLVAAHAAALGPPQQHVPEQPRAVRRSMPTDCVLNTTWNISSV